MFQVGNLQENEWWQFNLWITELVEMQTNHCCHTFKQSNINADESYEKHRQMSKLYLASPWWWRQ
jgi:hypothetical protein